MGGIGHFYSTSMNLLLFWDSLVTWLIFVSFYAKEWQLWPHTVWARSVTEGSVRPGAQRGLELLSLHLHHVMLVNVWQSLGGWSSHRGPAVVLTSSFCNPALEFARKHTGEVMVSLFQCTLPLNLQRGPYQVIKAKSLRQLAKFWFAPYSRVFTQNPKGVENSHCCLQQILEELPCGTVMQFLFCLPDTQFVCKLVGFYVSKSIFPKMER